ncbi:MAG: hypothetical protein ACE5H8_12330, partial [Alphaproteobacteria bacterium]
GIGSYAENEFPPTIGHDRRIEEAKAAVEKYNEIVAKTIGSPLTLQSVESWYGGWMYDYDKTYLRQWVEGLRKAGVVEEPTAAPADIDFKDLVSKNAGIFDVEGAVKIDAAGPRHCSTGAWSSSTRVQTALTAGDIFQMPSTSIRSRI